MHAQFMRGERTRGRTMRTNRSLHMTQQALAFVGAENGAYELVGRSRHHCIHESV